MTYREKPVRAMLIIGPTGSGKTPLGEIIEQKSPAGRRCYHLDFGEELRNIAKCEVLPSNFTFEDRKFVRGVLDKGLLLEDEHFHIARKITDNFLFEKGFKNSDLLLLNGLPRHVGQAQDMKSIAEVIGIILLECSAEDVYTRIHQNTGGDRTSRVDDSVAMIRKKLEIYRGRTEPLVKHYSSMGCRIFHIDVNAATSAEDIHEEWLAMDPFT